MTKPTLAFGALGLNALSIILAIIAIGLPAWIVVAPGVNNPYTFIDDGYSTQLGLFQFCQVVYWNYDCRYFDGFECIGGPDSWAFCNMRRAAAGLMITGLLLSIIACAYFGALGLKESSAKSTGLIAGSITILAVILYVIAMSLMVYVERIVEFNSLRTGILPPGPVPPGPGMMIGNIPLFVYYGASFILAIVSWVFALLVGVLMIVYGISASKKTDDEPVIEHTQYSEVKE